MTAKTKAILLAIAITGAGWLIANEIGWQIQKMFRRGSDVFGTIGLIRYAIDFCAIFVLIKVYDKILRKLTSK
ncbi:hypothetical protein LJC59_01355 [Desulfovibrio sp. OttesenSCG-928-A18]|nr:hypothetical protein [Desulfovibrio sp. OttesenSCG-928-A18]